MITEFHEIAFVVLSLAFWDVIVLFEAVDILHNAIGSKGGSSVPVPLHFSLFAIGHNLYPTPQG